MTFYHPVNKALVKFCRTDTGYNSGNGFVNRNTIFKITISLQKIGMCFPKIRYISPSFCTRKNGTNSQQ
uniref:Uncharacterized protein n=1 Tax=Escherichia coli TaxID=562 RepID=X5FUZ3_ECOLX|nr:hypothetical protein [Escherichia coli]